MTERQQGDIAGQLQASVDKAARSGEPLYISAGGSKRELCGRACEARELDVSGHRGVVNYEPGELVLSARAGTTLSEIEALLRGEDQVLAFEPPTFAGAATLGGTLASNLSGPARPWAGSVRDMVLGVQLINGAGELLNFGGRVMKNVAGYDVSRLQAGALGTLGVLTEITLKVLPAHERSLTLCYEMDALAALDLMHRRAGQAAPLNGACWLDNTLRLRLSGTASSVAATADDWGGDLQEEEDGGSFWQALRDHTLPYFRGKGPLWRLSLASNSRILCDEPGLLIDWGGAQRWLRGEREPGPLQQLTAGAGGHVTLFAGGDRQSEVRQPLPAGEQRLQQALKRSFDPAGILNPGRLYSWM